MNKFLHRFPLVILLFSMIFSVKAQSVSLSEATVAADRFLHSQSKSLSQCAHVETAGTDTLFYIFNAENGFVVIGGDWRVPPVLAYSDNQLYNNQDVIPPVRMWLDNYKQQMIAVKSTPVSAADASNANVCAWRKLQNREPVFRTTGYVPPMLQTRWGQGAQYNYYCPQDFAGEGNHVVTGCVATAMAQIINYFRWPEHGVGTYSYIDSTYGEQFADYGNATYDYSAMTIAPNSINLEISKLMYHCGVGVDMVYGPDGSGMYNHSAANVLRDHFKYSPETRYAFRDSVTWNWDSLIVESLERNVPMYYAGWSVPNINGHAFICDGYQMMDSNCYFHFNFGWDGSANGYFYTDHLIVSGSNFNLAQELIINAYPDTINYEYPVPQQLTGSLLLTSPDGFITDGSLPLQSYSANMDFTWTIRPDVENLTRISVRGFYDIAPGDTLFITANDNTFTPYVITGDSSAISFGTNGTELVVRFVSDDTLARFGFSLGYTTISTQYCHGVVSSNTNSGNITDGSDEDDYVAFSDCHFRIIVAGSPYTMLHINYLDLEEDRDFLYVFDELPRNDRLLMALTGEMSDTTIFVNKRKLYFIFTSDEANNRAGFDIDYYGTTGVEELEMDGFRAYPNPVSDELNIHTASPMKVAVLRDMTGRELRRVVVDDNSFTLPVSSLADGVYLLQIQMDNKLIVKKIVVSK